MKNWYQSKVIWMAIIQAVVAILVIVQSNSPSWAGDLLLVKSVLDIILRSLTTTQIKQG